MFFVRYKINCPILLYLVIYYLYVCQVPSRAMANSQSPASHRRDPASIRGRCMWDLWRTVWYSDRGISQNFCFPLSVSFHQCSTLIFICMLLLAEGQTRAAWEPPKSNALSEFGKPRLEHCCHTCCEGRNSVVGTVA